MTIDYFMLWYPDVPITTEQVQSCHYLDSVGFRFAVDYGYSDCERLAFNHMAAQIEELKRNVSGGQRC